MNNIYQVFLISDSTGETLHGIFLALQAQFPNFKYKINQYSFVRTNNQIDKIVSKSEKITNRIIFYTIVDSNLTKYIESKCYERNIPCFAPLSNLIANVSKTLHQKASHKPSGQHVLDDEYYKRIEAIQFTMSHDDGKILSDLQKSDILLVGVSRTSKTPTSIYLANRGYKTSNIPIIPNENLSEEVVESSKKTCTIGLVCDSTRLLDVRRNRIHSMRADRPSEYINEEKIINELENSKKLFKKYKWPVIDVTRKSVEETAASVIKIFDILNS
jgi:regulator of PEP synthase PpsR (kinase-PPPase family)